MTLQASSAAADPPLVFETPLAIVGGGLVDGALLAELHDRGVALVGADGGADAIAAAGLEPVAIVGDLDSLKDSKAWETRTRVLRISEQQTTDFQKALYSTRAPVTIALGMTGGRLDHTLAALSAILEYAPLRRLMLVDDVDVAAAVTGPIRFPAAPGERVSIHPLSPIAFKQSRGLAYDLDGLVLEPGGRSGTSNVATSSDVDIQPAASTPWLLMLERRRLWDLMAILGDG